MNDKVLKNILLSDEEYVKQERYWIDRLNGFEKTELLYNYGIKNISKDTAMKEELNIELPDDICKELLKISKGNDLLLYIVFVSTLKNIIYRYTSNSEIGIWSPIFMMNYTEKTLNKLVLLKSHVDEEDSIKNLILKVRKTCIEAYKNQDFPFKEIENKLQIEDSFNESPFSEVLCMLSNIHDEKCAEDFMGNVSFKFTRNEEKISMKMVYKSSKYNLEIIKGFASNYIKLLHSSISNMDKKIIEVECLSSDESNIILNKFNKEYIEFNQDIVLSQLFEKVVNEEPEKSAIVYKEDKISYKELNEKANIFARKLVRAGVKPRDIVGIMMNKTADMIIALLAVLKTGAAYLPLDPKYPADRVYEISKDSGLNIIVKDNLDIKTVKVNGQTLEMNSYQEEVFEDNNENLECHINSSDLAYIIYTSGSTGKPKGVMVEHKGVVNLLNWFNSIMNVKDNKNILQLTNITFDVSVEEIFGSLLYGGTLFIPDKDTILSREKIRAYIEDNNINIAQFVPVTLREFLLGGEKIKCLNKVICGGDKLDDYLKEKITSLGYELYNNYGPTETTVDALSLKCTERKVTLGKPINNTKIYIMNKAMKMQPIEAIGEICISGYGVTRGYMNNEKLTSEKFIDDPFVEGKKLYKTGDLGRWLSDGEVEFLERVDNQVKIRGFRIEIGEIEYWLKKYENVEDAVIAVKSDDSGNKDLYAYIQSREELNVADIKKYLEGHLTSYMVPAFFVILEKLPVTANGKIDKKALKLLENKERKLSKYELPQNEIEKVMVDAWKDVLGVKVISRNDNFFELGGDSIKAIQIVSSLLRNNLEIDIKDIFEYKNISEISNYVKAKEIIEKDDEVITGDVKLAPIQKWFFEQNYTNSNHWNNSIMLFNKNGFDGDKVEHVFEKIIEHHDALRMSYKKSNGNITQVNLPYEAGTYKLVKKDLLKDFNYMNTLENECNKLQESFDLSKGHLIKTELFKTIEGDYLLIAAHHLIIDGISWRIILEDFDKGYNSLLENKKIKFQNKTSSYKLWTENVYKYASSKKLMDEIKYWRNIENEEVKMINKDMKAESNKIKDSKIASICLSKEETEKFIKEVNKAYNTNPNDILLTALGIAVKKCTGMEKILINLEGHGREALFKGIDISRTVGWFTSTYPVILNMKKDEDISYIIRFTKEELRKVPNNGFGYNVLRYVTDLQSMGEDEFKLNPEIGFNYLGEFDREGNTSNFVVSEISNGNQVSGEAERINSIDINGMIVNKILTFTFNYNVKEFKESTIEKFMTEFKLALELIIKHCTEIKEKKITPTDLGYSKLSIEGLDKVMDILNK